jgi:hypothetical protein
LSGVSIVQVTAQFGTHKKTKVAQKRNDLRLGFWIWRCWRKQSDQRTLSGTSVCVVIKRGTRHGGNPAVAWQGRLFVALLGSQAEEQRDLPASGREEKLGRAVKRIELNLLVHVIPRSKDASRLSPMGRDFPLGVLAAHDRDCHMATLTWTRLMGTTVSLPT